MEKSSWFVAGIFLTESAESAKRAWFYCRECHKNVKSELQIQNCPCKKNATRNQYYENYFAAYEC